MEKMTNVKAINFVLENCEITVEVREKLEKMKASFEKKASGEKKPTANQLANEGLKTAIVEYLANGEQKTISEMIKGCEVLAEMSNQKVSALVKALVDAKILVREEIKRKAYFKLA